MYLPVCIYGPTQATIYGGIVPAVFELVTTGRARFSTNPNWQHMSAVLRIFACLAGTKSRATWLKRTNVVDPKGYVDADYAGCLDTRRSTT